MAHITKHHTEEEWESYNSNNSRVSFLIGWNTISVNDQLERHCEIISLNVSWSWDCMVVISHNLCC
jgi:hypothetical protein